VFLISLKAGGSGLTLTEADTVIHFDPWWNPAVEDQATDRAHRIGQDKPVMVYRLVCEDTVEQKMVELGARKREVAESALGRDQTAGKKLSIEDVEALLESPATPAWERE
jgi:SNF2 family DNA or RNA helicase